MKCLYTTPRTSTQSLAFPSALGEVFPPFRSRYKAMMLQLIMQSNQELLVRVQSFWAGMEVTLISHRGKLPERFPNHFSTRKFHTRCQRKSLCTPCPLLPHPGRVSLSNFFPDYIGNRLWQYAFLEKDSFLTLFLVLGAD